MNQHSTQHEAWKINIKRHILASIQNYLKIDLKRDFKLLKIYPLATQYKIQLLNKYLDFECQSNET